MSGGWYVSPVTVSRLLHQPGLAGSKTAASSSRPSILCFLCNYPHHLTFPSSSGGPL